MKIYIKSAAYKRIARAEEFDNGHVIHNDWLKISDDEAEELAKQKSIEYPGSICYVQYDDIMNPSSDKQWVDGIEYHSYADALAAHKNHIIKSSKEIIKQDIIDNGGAMKIGWWHIEIGKLYDKKSQSYSGGFGQKTMVSNYKKGIDRVFNSPEKAIEFLNKQLNKSTPKED